MDVDLYDEFGNYIGPELESEPSEEEDEDEEDQDAEEGAGVRSGHERSDLTRCSYILILEFRCRVTGS